MPYRSEDGATERERQALIARIEALEGGWTPVFWARVAPSRELAPPADLGGADRDALVARLRALERIEAERAAIVRAWCDRPHPPRCEDSVELRAIEQWRERPSRLGDHFRSYLHPYRHVRDVEGVVDVALRLRAATAHLDADVRISRAGSRGFRVAFWLAIGCAPGLGALRLRPETTLHDLASALGFPDHQTGDPVFDGTFHVKGDLESARAVLDDRARRALVQMTAYGPVRLDLAHGAATLGAIWLGDAENAEPAIRAAVVVLERIAAAEPPALRA